MRFPLYLDEDTSGRGLVRALRREGWDVLTTVEAGRDRERDTDQLAFAASVGRVILTSNQGDFARIHGEWARAGRTHAGIIILTSQQTPIGVVTRKLASLGERTGAELVSAILFISR